LAVNIIVVYNYCTLLLQMGVYEFVSIVFVIEFIIFFILAHDSVSCVLRSWYMLSQKLITW